MKSIQTRPEADEEEWIARIRLSQVPGVGPVLCRHLLSYFGQAREVFSAGEKVLQKVPEIGSVTSSAIRKYKRSELPTREWDFVKKKKLKLFWIGDDDYPMRLRHCYDAPALIYSAGRVDFKGTKVISIIGTRMASEYGLQLCRDLVKGLKEYNVVIVSGLAYGIDSAAHWAAVEAGIPTIAVLGHGLSHLYPNVHQKLAKRMLEKSEGQYRGALYSEYLSFTPPDAKNFPSRNRIVAGLSDAVVVVESGEKGGALLTAGLALGYNRDVFAFPGRVGDPYSCGCNALIRDTRAGLIQNANELVKCMGWDIAPGKARNVQTSLFDSSLFSPDENQIIGMLRQNQRMHIDELSLNAGIPFSRLASLLLDLEMKGIIRGRPGNLYELK